VDGPGDGVCAGRAAGRGEFGDTQSATGAEPGVVFSRNFA